MSIAKGVSLVFLLVAVSVAVPLTLQVTDTISTENLVLLHTAALSCPAGTVGVAYFRTTGTDWNNEDGVDVVIYYIKYGQSETPTPVLQMVRKNEALAYILLKTLPAGGVERFTTLDDLKEKYPMLSGPCGLLIQNYGL